MKTTKGGAGASEAAQPSLLKSIDGYWFGFGSPVSMGVFRIFIGTLSFLNWVLLSFDFRSWFTEHGFVPISTSQIINPDVDRNFRLFGQIFTLPFTVPRLQILHSVVSTDLTLAVFIVALVSSLFVAAGLWTRFSTILLAIATVSLHHRDAAILHGGDTALRICVLYVMLAPSGAAVSLDRWRARRKGIEGPTPRLVSLWPQRLIQYNMALIYFTTWWIKLDGIYWRAGLATYFTSRLPEFYRFPVPAFTKSVAASHVQTYLAALTELSLGTIVFWKPARKYVLIAGLLMHGYIEYSMNVPLFEWIMVSMYISFYSGEEIAQWYDRLKARVAKWRSVKEPEPHGTSAELSAS